MDPNTTRTSSLSTSSMIASTSSSASAASSVLSASSTSSPYLTQMISERTIHTALNSSCKINATVRAVRALSVEYKSLQEEPVEGFCVKLVNCDNLFEWEVAIFGPPDTLYMGGYFKARMRFPHDYPYSPPSIRFLTKVWHPNVYENGDLCISILHPAVGDAYSGELPCERWNPTQNVRTILLSVISLLNEPNTSSPANVDASVMYRRWRESKGRDNEYENIVRKQVQASRLDAEKDGIKIPLTREDYCIKTAAVTNKNLSGSSSSNATAIDMSDFYDDDDDYDLDDDDIEDDDEEDDVTSKCIGLAESSATNRQTIDSTTKRVDGDDSGNEES